MNFKIINGGVVAPKGFYATGLHCGIRSNPSKKDLSVIYSNVKGSAAAVYTKNKVKGAPIYVTQENLKNGIAQAIICNSGNANTCNSNGIEIAEEMCQLLSKKLNINANDVIVASTGVIGKKLSIEPIKNGINKIELNCNESGSIDANDGILTTDLIQKSIALEFLIDDKTCRIGIIAKGSGMIHPNMATMLAFITTDVNISQSMLQKALLNSVENTYNMLSVDGDTSTNDMVSIIANGNAENQIINEEDENFKIFSNALNFANENIVKLMASDGEGATKLLIVEVNGAKDNNCAKIISKSVCTSSLFKAAMFGMDANWGRVLCAVGYANAELSIDKISVEFVSENGNILVCKNGFGVDFDEDLAKKILKPTEITTKISLNDGKGSATAFGCDLTYDYVKINGDYRS